MFGFQCSVKRYHTFFVSDVYKRQIRGRAVGGFKAMEENQAFCGCCIAIGAAGTALVPLLGTEVQDRLVRMNLYMPGKLEFLIDSVPVQIDVYKRQGLYCARSALVFPSKMV